MKIEHIGLWVGNLDRMIEFYAKFFQGIPGKKYHNPSKNFTSCFIEFPSGPRLELMNNPALESHTDRKGPPLGYAHIALAAGSREEVDRLSGKLNQDGYRLIDGPRQTGDGYYESVILDPEGNRIEITV